MCAPLSPALLAAASDLAAAGGSLTAIARQLGIAGLSLRRYEKRGLLDLGGLQRAQAGRPRGRAPRDPFALPARVRARLQRRVPAWLADAGLRQEYVGNIVLYGEFGAASIARGQLATMRRGL